MIFTHTHTHTLSPCQSGTLYITSRHQYQTASHTSSIAVGGRPDSLKKKDASNSLTLSLTHTHTHTGTDRQRVNYTHDVGGSDIYCQEIVSGRDRQREVK